MIPIHISNQDVNIKKIEKSELSLVLEGINENKENYHNLGREDLFDLIEIEQRFLESLMNPLEIFCGLYINDILIGIIKGRIENKIENELYILSFILFQKYRNKGYGSKIIMQFEDFFINELSISKIYVLLVEDNKKGYNFWVKNNYNYSRRMESTWINNKTHIIIMEKFISNTLL